MNLFEKIYIYCERGGSAAFWAEPFNAVTNAGFILAALIAAFEFFRLPRERRHTAEGILIVVVFVIGIGSFLFHTFATRWALLADTIPISIFMLAYVGFALRNYFSLPWLLVILGLVLFVAAFRTTPYIPCPDQKTLLPITEATRGTCLNGSIRYVPALGVMYIMAALLFLRGHPVWGYIAAAGVVFTISMVARTFDIEICALARIDSRAIGTHFIWHLLNAVVLYLLLVGAIRHGRFGHNLQKS